MLPFALFLRPFETDFGLKYKPSSLLGASNILSPKYHTGDQQRYFEQLVERALKRDLGSVAIGGHASAQGPGKIYSSDADWQAKFFKLAAYASLILVVPLANEWTEWEVRKIVEKDYVRKTLFLMPPATPGYPIKRKWQLAQSAHSQRLNGFPDYNSDGAVFAVNVAGQCEVQATGSPIFRSVSIKRLIRRGYLQLEAQGRLGPHAF